MRERASSAVSILRERTANERLRRDLERQTGARIHRTADVRGWDRLHLGPEVVIDSGVVLHCGGMGWSGGKGSISIGARSYVGPNCVLFGAGGVDIGEAALISPGVVITAQQHTIEDRGIDIREQPLAFAEVVIERNVWIGANATILPGVRLGEGCVVAAGAVVTRDVPPMALVMGVPARVARER